MPSHCSKCGQPLIPAESKCVYCGTPISSSPSFGAVSGGVNIDGDHTHIGGDVVGHDKIVQNILNYFATDHAHEAPPAPPRLRRELSERIGQQQHLDALHAAWKRVTTKGRGHAIFLTGPAGYGRKATARDFMAAHTPAAIALTLPFFPVEGLPPDEIATLWRSDPRQQAALTQYAADIARRFPFAVKIAGAPWLVLVAQLIDQCPSLLQDTRNRYDDPMALNHLLRVAAKTRPILLSVEDLGLATDPLWITVLKSLLEESARDWPLLLIASVATPRPIERIEKDDLHEALWLIKDLQKAGLAEARFFEAATSADVAAYINPAQAGMAERLCQLTAGHPLVIETLPFIRFAKHPLKETIRHSRGVGSGAGEVREGMKGRQRMSVANKRIGVACHPIIRLAQPSVEENHPSPAPRWNGCGESWGTDERPSANTKRINGYGSRAIRLSASRSIR